MTEKQNNISLDSTSNYKKLSIQISLNGLSFCIVDTIDNTILDSKTTVFDSERTPIELEKELVTQFEAQNMASQQFAEVIVTHRNTLFCFVPKAIFIEEELTNYLKYNTKVLATDLISYDEVENYEMINVYVPFMNINNYIYDLFGEFTYKHSSAIITASLLNNNNGKDVSCYVYASEHQMDVTVISKKKLLLFNSFEFSTTEDFLYYLLFTCEQLKLDTDSLQLRLFGDIEEESAIFKGCYEHIQNVSIYVPDTTTFHLGDYSKKSIDFTLLNAL